MKSKTILILEDHESQREDLSGALRDRGFRVESAGTISEARMLATMLGEQVDVMMLDMAIEGSEITGAEFGIEVKDQLNHWPPEFLIHSAYGESEYYQLALRLGAATYLRKPAADLSDIVRHVRVLALRRSLFPGHSALTETIDRIADESRSSSEAIVQFCREILVPELKATLGGSFALIVSTSAETHCFGSGVDLTVSAHFLEWLQSLVHLRLPTEPLIIGSDFVLEGLTETERLAACGVLEHLQGAAFVPLGRTSLRRAENSGGLEDVRLSLGIIQRGWDQPLVESAVDLAKLIGAFIQPALVQHLLTLTSRLLSTRQRATLEATADFCLQVGQEQVAAFSRAIEAGVLSHDELPPDLERILILSEKLRKAGELLTWICRPRETRQRTGDSKLSSVARVVREAWQDLLLEVTSLDPHLLTIEGDCWISGNPEEIQIAVSKLLRWLSWRAMETPKGVTPGLRVSCHSISEKRESHIVFEDRSQRLPKMLRSRVFSALVPPLLGESETQAGRGEILDPYIAKMLIEMESGGSMEDRSDELEGDLGHRVVVCLPETQPGTALL